MNKTIHYAAHPKPIQLAPRHPRENGDLLILQTVSLLSNAHQQFLLQQAEMQKQFIANVIPSPLRERARVRGESKNNFVLSTPSSAASQRLLPQGRSENNYPGPHFTRADLEFLASEKISEKFGEWFKPLDQYDRVIRMPKPPLLLADRVLGIDAEPGKMGKGTIWTETDVKEDSWYLHHNRMPAGIMVESGQADLLLASWLGLDFHNQGKRVYRLLGCDLSYHGELPKPGDTLHYEIKIDSYANQGPIRLFFFHYDCTINGEIRLRARNGQAGFFTDEELANSGGILWDIKEAECDLSSPHDIPKITQHAKQFSKEQLIAFSEGKISECFGVGFEWIKTHLRTPTVCRGNMFFLDQITDFDLQGGPWKRGYMRAVQNLSPEDWFFEGHFKNDPCMPGTLMFEGCFQAMSFYLTALGYTLDKDGWRFEPVSEQIYKLRCRAQAIPSSKQIVYEMFVNNIVASPKPTVFADMLVTIDGLKAFHARIGLSLVPDWVLSSEKIIELKNQDQKPAFTLEGFTYDYASLQACALGKPTDAFGEMYKAFDSERRVARLPGPPYLFMSRIVDIKGEAGVLKSGSEATVEYDIPKDAWYFQNGEKSIMPFCILLEAALQPCGWLASFMGSALNAKQDLAFRNLDGTGNYHHPVFSNAGVLRTHVKLVSVSPSASMIIESFEVKCYVGNHLVYEMNSVFGFFPQSAFENQVGLPISHEDQKWISESSNMAVDLGHRHSKYFQDKLNLPDSQLLMIDRVTGFWKLDPQQGIAQLRAEKSIDASAWFFKAHFFQDPVQPGSLGMEAMLQLLQFYMLHENMHQDIQDPVFQAAGIDFSHSWRYRGQVIPTNKTISTLLTVTEKGEDKNGVYAKAQASLWVDGKRIYEAKNLSMHIVSKKSLGKKTLKEIFQMDPTKDAWILDHCPTYLIPAMSMMSMVDCMAAAVKKNLSSQKIVALEKIQVLDWFIVNEPLDIEVEVNFISAEQAQVTLFKAIQGQLKVFAKCVVRFAENYVVPEIALTALNQDRKSIDPYLNLFHGDQFKLLQKCEMDSMGSSSVLNASHANASFGFYNHLLFDALTHGIPHDNLSQWSSEISTEFVAYPAFITKIEFFKEPNFTGELRCETRFAGFHLSKQYPKFLIVLFEKDQVVAKMELVEALFPKGRLGNVSPIERRDFLRDKKHVSNMSLSYVENDTTCLTIKTVQETDWLPGSIAKLYNVTGDLESMTKQITIKEHFARQWKAHPSEIILKENENLAEYQNHSANYQLKKNNELFVVS